LQQQIRQKNLGKCVCSMDVDLSQQLKRRKVGLSERIASINPSFEPDAPQRKPTIYKPTQADSRRWERGGKFSTMVFLKSLKHTPQIPEAHPTRTYTHTTGRPTQITVESA
jgi:hypothetical protein